jgi:hypothetical protein
MIRPLSGLAPLRCTDAVPGPLPWRGNEVESGGDTAGGDTAGGNTAGGNTAGGDTAGGDAAAAHSGLSQEVGARTPGAGEAPYSRRVVPPGSSALRELLATLVSALEVKPPTEARDLAAYRYLLAARARAVRQAARRLLDDREADDEDVMIAVWSLRDQLRELTPTYQEHPLAS